MGEIIPSNALQTGTKLYVEGIPVTVEEAEIDFDWDHTIHREGGLGKHEFNGYGWCTGELKVRISPDNIDRFLVASTKKRGMVIVAIGGKTTADFAVTNITTDLHGGVAEMYAESRIVPYFPEQELMALP
jgi:hypothetical protein